MKRRVSYKEAGVDIDAGDAFVLRIKGLVESTFRAEVHGELGGFSGAVSLPLEGMKRPLLVSSTDGVGTKLKIAFKMDRHDTVGIDLVAMCVNDLVVTGARPLFFLDYLSMGKLDSDKAFQIVQGIAKGCQEAECSLIGGETAEMPGFYGEGEYDLAGFAVGLVDEDRAIDSSRVKSGDRIIGIASNGLHSNGFSLVRRVVFDLLKLGVDDWVDELENYLGEELLKPTRIYVRPIMDLARGFPISAIAHITGGGISGNLSRVIPPGLGGIVDKGSWEVPMIFRFLEKRGKIAEEEMWRTFNNGIGMALIVRPADADAIMKRAQELGEQSFLIGKIVQGEVVEIR
ncbi:MAG: phosphoribosylformylglycinamidine cyclo-ligase [Proteobacteria bacterium]|nr:phosphoribosylformylglycinamidine cyclo-ligase [Pseudomonadota bacterium]NIS67458.1 phosphoribosylformylglycinamidine cyclo-ligase [Pseudomonadota bacterium]